MTTITTRAGKGSPLTNTEMDTNLTNLNSDKLEKTSNLSDLNNTTTARSNLGLGSMATQTVPTGVIKGNGTTVSAASAGTDYLAPPSGTAILKANSGGALANATAGTDYAAPATESNWTAAQRSAIITDNDLSFDLSAGGNNYVCTPSAGGTLTFTNIAEQGGKSGFIKLVNGSNYAIAAAATTKIAAADLTKISASGTYILSYLCDATNVYVMTSVSLP